MRYDNKTIELLLRNQNETGINGSFIIVLRMVVHVYRCINACIDARVCVVTNGSSGNRKRLIKNIVNFENVEQIE